MSTIRNYATYLPPEQQAILDRCFHPAGTFIRFQREDIEQSIPDRFEQQVRRFNHRLAIMLVKSGKQTSKISSGCWMS